MRSDTWLDSWMFSYSGKDAPSCSKICALALQSGQRKTMICCSGRRPTSTYVRSFQSLGAFLSFLYIIYHLSPHVVALVMLNKQ